MDRPRTLDDLSPAPTALEIAPSAKPFGPLALAGSALAIAVIALLICCLCAALAVVAVFAQVGADGTFEVMERLRFDLPLKTRIGAATVTALYIGVAVATVGFAWAKGRKAWMTLVALRAPSRISLDVVALAVMTLVYGGVAAFVMAHAQDRHLLISGPTDVVLLGTIATNLCLLAPLAEELFFRGWLYTGLRSRFPFWPSFLATTALFAAIHWDTSHRRFFLVMPLAVALGLIREGTGSIRPTMLVHALYNLIVIVITLVEF